MVGAGCRHTYGRKLSRVKTEDSGHGDETDFPVHPVGSSVGVSFNISGAGVHTVSPTSGLPTTAQSRHWRQGLRQQESGHQATRSRCGDGCRREVNHAFGRPNRYERGDKKRVGVPRLRGPSD
jgi:hypothetical protein